MKTIRTARTVVGALVTAAALSACASHSEDTTYLSAAEIDKGCILTASDKLRQILRLDADNARALPSPTSGLNTRLVELDATNMKMPVTYVFLCSTGHGYFIASPLGRK